MNALEIARLVTDHYGIRILARTHYKEQSARQLNRDCGISMALVYRRLHELEGLNLIECVNRPLTAQGKRYGLYRSLLKRASIEIDNSTMRVSLTFKDGSVKEFERVAL